MIDVFKVGVHIGMTTNSPQVLSVMLAQLTGIHIAAGKVSGALGVIRTAALGAGAVFAGWAVIRGLIDATKHAENLNHELVKLQTGARLTDAQTTGAANLAFQTTRNVPGSNAADNVKVQRELFGVFGDMGTAQSLLNMVVQGSRATSNFVDKDTDLAKLAVRALELRGHITKDHKVDPVEFANEFNSMVRSIVASEGLVDPQKLLMFIQQAGPAARGMTPDAMWGMTPAIMNALGPSKAGTAINSLFAQMIGHVVTGKRVAVAMEEAGMLTPGKWRVERGGKVRMDADAVPDQEGFAANPYLWLHNHLAEMRNQKGPDGKPVDTTRIVQEIFQLSSRATSARLISDIDANWPIIENEMRRYQRMPDPADINKEQNDKDLPVNIHNLSAAWDNFMTALGGPGIPVAINVLQKLTNVLNWLQEQVIKHPQAAAQLFYLAGGIAALTALSGSLMLFNLALTPLVSGIRLLTGIGTASIAGVGTGLSSLAGGISALLLVLTGAGFYAFLHEALPAMFGTDFHNAQGGHGNGRSPNSSGHGNAPYVPGGTGHGGGSTTADPNFHRESMRGPAGDNGAVIQTTTYIQLDKKTIARAVSEEQARAMSLPPTGSTRFDGRMAPSYPGDTVPL